MRSNSAKTIYLTLVAILIALFATPLVYSQTVPGGCGTLRSEGQYGPYDPRKDPSKLPIVLGAHFTPEIEMLIRGRTGSLGGEIGYTLRAIPNYHRALLAMMRYGEKTNSDQPKDSTYTIDCWFQRAIAFAPDDAIVRMIYSTYLNSKGRAPEANAQLEAATVYAKDDPFTHYNIGLHYFDIKNYDKALLEAHKAIELGFTHTDLKDQLQKIGKWSEPAGVAAAAVAAPASAPADASK